MTDHETQVRALRGKYRDALGGMTDKPRRPHAPIRSDELRESPLVYYAGHRIAVLPVWAQDLISHYQDELERMDKYIERLEYGIDKLAGRHRDEDLREP